MSMIGELHLSLEEGEREETKMKRKHTASSLKEEKSQSSLEEKKSSDSESALDWKVVLKRRSQLTKHSRFGKPKLRTFCVNSKTGEFYWNDEPKGLNVASLVGVSHGKIGVPFQRDWAFDVDANVCFTLHFKKRDVCLQASSVQYKEEFLAALTACNEKLTAKRRKSIRVSAVENERNVEDEKPLIPDDLPDRALSKHMRKARRAQSQKNILADIKASNEQENSPVETLPPKPAVLIISEDHHDRIRSQLG
jgi:hypothetical protein